MPDIVFLHGEVITVDEQNRIVEAIAVKRNRIIAVGTSEEIKRLISPQTTVIDLKGKTLLPGFIDSHLHISSYGIDKLGVSCKATHIHSLQDIFQDLRKKASGLPAEKWVRAWGFNETKIAEQRYPTREELDQISMEHPIIIIRACNHISVVNSKALEILGIHKDTPDPKGGMIEHSAEGELTGRLIETAHFQISNKVTYSEEETAQALALASADFVAAGITSIHDAGCNDSEGFRAMHEAVRQGLVKVRIYAMVCALDNPELFLESMINAGMVTGLGNDRFKIGPAKLFTDGSSSGPTIATRKPYTSNPEDYGILYYTQEELNRQLVEAHKKGFQITAHAQGDRAIEMVLNCIEAALKEYPRPNARPRIEHAGISEPDLIERMKQLGVIPIPNPAFFYEYGNGYVHNYGDRVNQMYPLRDFFKNNIIAAAGSDSPVTDYRPLFGIQAAVNRKSKQGQEIGNDQTVSVTEAIRAYTWNGAYASFDEQYKGSIEVGKLADLVILDGSILQAAPADIADLPVHMTIIDGEIVYQAG
ncbi:N-substituted formamide deformylase [Bacillus rhizoplanae]|uniref:N-substituted formamide deformylase n=1 Tax=Bacillus rhizoplanae TaxID=2880966 RepID=A0ABM8YC42_9BACI|nr:amidohydrolase [Bacillus rhizoplanae]CAG9613337.1 N-substituted formamide deformylase [Bacillus rhizoplanae]